MPTPRACFLAKLQCPTCSGRGLVDGSAALLCPSCGASVPLRRGLPAFAAAALAHDEALEQQLASSAGRFRRARWYGLEKAVLEVVNHKDHLPITPHLVGREVLDVACGPEAYDYDPAITALHVGIDVSLPFLVEAATARPNSFFACAWAHRLPFADRSFDTVLLLQALHHMPQPYREVLGEACRVAREKVIVYDHLQSAAGPRRWLKTLWWRLADGGVHYNTAEQWREVLADLTVVEQRTTGRYLDNIYEFVISIEPASPAGSQPAPRRQPG